MPPTRTASSVPATAQRRTVRVVTRNTAATSRSVRSSVGRAWETPVAMRTKHDSQTAPQTRTFRFPTGGDLCSNGRQQIRQQLAAQTLLDALLAGSEFRLAAIDVRDAADRPGRADEIARRFGVRGNGRPVVAELLLRASEDPDVRHAALLLNARAYWVEDTGPRWVVEGDHGEHVFFEDGEDEARQLAAELGCDVTYRPGSTARPRHYAVGQSFVIPLSVAARCVAARAAGDCVGWHGRGSDRRPCQSKAAVGYRPYCGLHGGWDYRRKRDAWDVEREEGVRRLFKLAAPAVLDGRQAAPDREQIWPPEHPPGGGPWTRDAREAWLAGQRAH